MRPPHSTLPSHTSQETLHPDLETQPLLPRQRPVFIPRPRRRTPYPSHEPGEFDGFFSQSCCASVFLVALLLALLLWLPLWLDGVFDL